MKSVACVEAERDEGGYVIDHGVDVAAGLGDGYPFMVAGAGVVDCGDAHFGGYEGRGWWYILCQCGETMSSNLVVSRLKFTLFLLRTLGVAFSKLLGCCLIGVIVYVRVDDTG